MTTAGGSTFQRSRGRPPRVVVGIDGSWPARAALQWAARYARATQSALYAVRVLEWPIGFSATSQAPSGPTLNVPESELDPSYRNGMTRILDETDPLPGWRLTFAEGPTAPMLVQLAENADLLVLGSRVLASSGDARNGDIGRYCISRSSRPVVVVPVEYLDQVPHPPLADPLDDGDGDGDDDAAEPDRVVHQLAGSSPPEEAAEPRVSLRQRIKARALARWADDGGRQ